jgi:hypothetical protein
MHLNFEYNNLAFTIKQDRAMLRSNLSGLLGLARAAISAALFAALGKLMR